MGSLQPVLEGIWIFLLIWVFLAYFPKFFLGMILVGIVLFVIFFSLGILITVWEVKKQRKTRT